MATPPPHFFVLANSLLTAAQQIKRMEDHPPLTAAVLNQQLQEQSQQELPQIQQQFQLFQQQIQ